MFFGKKPQTPAPGTEPETPQTAAAAPTPAPAASAAGAAHTNSGPVTEISAEEAKVRAAAAKQLAAAFGEVVTLLLRSPAERFLFVHDLEWLVLPAIIRGQFAIAEAQSKETGAVSPVGVVLWAFVSPEVDQRLKEQPGDAMLRLSPNDWRSGEIPWIVLATGDGKVLGSLLQQVSSNVFKGKPATIRARGPDGKVMIGQLEAKPETVQ